MKNNFVRNLPVARFFYKGSHSHPVKRTVLIVKKNNKIAVGYELREGMEKRSFQNAPIKTYRLDRIAKINQIDKRCSLRKQVDNFEVSTFQRYPLVNLIENGI